MKYFLNFVFVGCCLILIYQAIFAQTNDMNISNSTSNTEYVSYLRSCDFSNISTPSTDIIEFFHSSSIVFEYAIQVGAFAKKDNAFRLQNKLLGDGYRTHVYDVNLAGKPLLYLVWVNADESVDDAYILWQKIKKDYKISGLLRVRSITPYTTMNSSLTMK